MNGQYLQTGSTTPSVVLSFLNPATGLPRTDLVFNTASLSIGYRRPGGTVQTVTLATLSAVDAAYVSGGFLNVSRGVYRLDLPAAAVTAGAASVAIVAVNMPTDVVLVPCVVALGPDDRAATTIAAAVRSNLTVELGRLDAPVSGALSSAALTSQINTLRQALSVGAKFGGPVGGGSSAVTPVYDAGNSSVLLGTVIIYRDANRDVCGQSELTPP